MLKKELKKTQDGSMTLYIPDWNESYHSKHGAVQEALHVFLKFGLQRFSHQKSIKVLEFGFGTGLNAIISLLFAELYKIEIEYFTIEKYPINLELATKLDFEESLSAVFSTFSSGKILAHFTNLHAVEWGKSVSVSEKFNINKMEADFREFNLEKESFDIVFFDAFGMRVQPELWKESLFEKIYNSLNLNGLLTTYACNGQTKRALKACGFDVEKKPGPPGKREMINAWKR